ncbi:MAG: hypothetical protein O3C34_00885 [Proteobacteria bacterium]|nr:hypothetical protein [Pseudomonadota bacterium]
MDDVDQKFELAGRLDAAVALDLFDQLGGLLFADIAPRVALPDEVIGQNVHIETSPVRALDLAVLIQVKYRICLGGADDAIREHLAAQLQHILGRYLALRAKGPNKDFEN